MFEMFPLHRVVPVPTHMFEMFPLHQVVPVPHSHAEGPRETEARRRMEEQGWGNHMVQVRLSQNAGAFLAEGIQTSK